MKFSVTKEKLLEGLQQVQNVVSTRTTLPILSNVLLQANGSEVHLTTTDLDVGVRGSFEAKVEKEGATTLPARRLFTIIRELPSSEIQIDVDGKNAASIRSGQSFFKILGLPEEEFPPLPKFENAKVVTIRQKDLRDGLRKTSYAISTDETRYVLNGVLFSFKENKLTLVATDGRRLAMVDIELEFPRSHEADIIVPTKAVTELQRLLTDEGEVKVSVGSGQIAFDLNNTLLVSKLIEGNYPNYKQVIPSEDEGARHARARNVSEFAAARFAAGERQIEFDQTEFQQEQHRHHREHAGSRRSEGIAAGRLQRARFFDRVQSGVFDGAAAQPDRGRSFSRSDRRDEPGRAEDSDAVSLRPDADAHQFVIADAVARAHTDTSSSDAVADLDEAMHAIRDTCGHFRSRRPNRRIGRTEKRKQRAPAAAAR